MKTSSSSILSLRCLDTHSVSSPQRLSISVQSFYFCTDFPLQLPHLHVSVTLFFFECLVTLLSRRRLTKLLVVIFLSSTTVIQLVQFAIGIAHALQIYYVPGCDYSFGVATFELLEAIFFFVVFFNFYRKSYWRARKLTTDNNNKVKSS